jgi:hypothetical protein
MNELYRIIKTVDIAPALTTLHAVKFIDLNEGRTGNTYLCDVALESSFTLELRCLLGTLNLRGIRRRAMLRRLNPKQGIPSHIDKMEVDKWKRFHVPLISNPAIKMRWPDDEVELYLEPGYLYEVRVDRKHEVINNSNTYRIHLQIDQIDPE